MRFSFLSLFALASAVYVTETEYNTFYVTVGPNGEPIVAAPASTPAPVKSSSSLSSSASVGASSSSILSSISSPVAAFPTDPTISTTSSSTSSTPSTTSTSSTSSTSTTSSSTSTSTTSSTTSTTPSTTTSTTPTTTPTPSTTSTSSTSSTSDVPAPSSTLSAFEADIVDYHNRVRAQHQVGSVSWNNTLAEFAQNYLDGDNCVFKHSNGPYGENIAIGYATIDAAQDAWYNEEDEYNYSAGQFTESTGHFTQMVWKGTNQVGCATQDCSGRTFLVCEYYPRGNIIGSFVENVLPK